MNIPPLEELGCLYDGWARTNNGNTWRIRYVSYPFHYEEVCDFKQLKADGRWKEVRHPAPAGTSFETKSEAAAKDFNMRRAWREFHSIPSI